MQSTVSIFTDTAALGSLSRDALGRLARAAEEADVDAGVTIDDVEGEYLYVVRSGTVVVERTGDGTALPPRAVGPLEVFGWPDPQRAAYDRARARTERATSLLRIPARDVLDVLTHEADGAATTAAIALASRGVAAPTPSPSSAPPPAVAAARPLLAAPSPTARVPVELLSRTVEWLRNPKTYLMLLGYALLFGGWYLAVEVLALPRFVKFPGLTQVVHEWLSRDPVFGLSIYTPVYYDHIWASLRRVGIAFFLATTLGVPVGLFLGWSTTFREYVFPVFELLRPIPILAWVPLAIIVFSGSETPVIFLTFLASFFATALNTRLGVKSIDPQYVLAAGCLGASRWQTFWHVIVPGALPFVFTGLQISIGVAWFSLAAAEMVSGQFGLGYLINTSYTMVQYPTIIIGMLTLGVAGYTTSAAVRVAGHRLMTWRTRELGTGRG